MKVRKQAGQGEDKIELQMTPMIDIVFQLLVFFIMTFKIVSQEGDFNIKMPEQGFSEAPPLNSPLPPINITMRSIPPGQEANRKEGDLLELKFNQETFPVFYKRVQETGANGAKKTVEVVDIEQTFGRIRNRLIDLGTDARKEQEVTIKCDERLRYERVINAMTYIRGYLGDDGKTVVPLIEKININRL